VKKRRHYPKLKYSPTVPNENRPWLGLVAYGYNAPIDLLDWFDAHRRRGLDGLQRMMLAILKDAVEAANWKENGTVYKQSTHNSSKSRRERERDEAQAWIEKVDPSFVFSFDSVCESLNLNPSVWRKKLVARYGEKAA
jgi:hypothetical protein